VLIGLLGTPWHSHLAARLNPEEAAVMADRFSWGEFLPLGGISLAPMPALVAKGAQPGEALRVITEVERFAA
jgi:hypothetical protein